MWRPIAMRTIFDRSTVVDRILFLNSAEDDTTVHQRTVIHATYVLVWRRQLCYFLRACVKCRRSGVGVEDVVQQVAALPIFYVVLHVTTRGVLYAQLASHAGYSNVYPRHLGRCNDVSTEFMISVCRYHVGTPRQ
jgi:hypothetical protein